MAQLLAYAIRRPPLPVRSASFGVQLFDGSQEINPSGLAHNSAFPDNMFDGTPTGPVGQFLTDECTHFKYGCVLDSVPEAGVKVKVKARFTYELENTVHTYGFERDLALTVEAGENPLYYSYVKDELNRKQVSLDGSRNQSLVDQYKHQMVNLSTTTNLLCSLTAFIGVKSEIPKRQADSPMKQVSRAYKFLSGRLSGRHVYES